MNKNSTARRRIAVAAGAAVVLAGFATGPALADPNTETRLPADGVTAIERTGDTWTMTLDGTPWEVKRMSPVNTVLCGTNYGRPCPSVVTWTSDGHCQYLQVDWQGQHNSSDPYVCRDDDEPTATPTETTPAPTSTPTVEPTTTPTETTEPTVTPTSTYDPSVEPTPTGPAAEETVTPQNPDETIGRPTDEPTTGRAPFLGIEPMNPRHVTAEPATETTTKAARAAHRAEPASAAIETGEGANASTRNTTMIGAGIAALLLASTGTVTAIIRRRGRHE